MTNSPSHFQEKSKEVVDFQKYRSLKFLEDKLATGRLTSEQIEKVHLVINEIQEGRATVKFDKDGTVRIVETRKIPMRLKKRGKENSDVPTIN
jgi:hypothetical protein